MDALLKDIPLTMLLIAGGMVGVIVVGGLLLSLFSGFLTNYISRTSPGEKKMNAWSDAQFKQTTKELDTPKKVSMGPRAEPLAISAAGFAVVFILSQIFVTVPPEVIDCKKEANKTLPTCIEQAAAAKVRVVVPRDAKAAKDVTDDILTLQGDAARGLALYTERGCVGCHGLNQGELKVGPSFYGVHTLGATRKEGYSADMYLLESIVRPGAFIVTGFSDGVMPANYAAPGPNQIKKQDMADMLAWMRTANAQK
jgi:mono/diheme cytochrome c family protein